MQKFLVANVIGSQQAPTVVLFGGSPYRRDNVVRILSNLGDLTIYGTLNEAKGIEKIESLNYKVDVVLIGGQYTPEQRMRITAWAKDKIPNVSFSQPGLDYPYSNSAILKDIESKMEWKKVA